MSTIELERATLSLEGMTCAGCAARIEQRLNKLDGVDASVNLATEQATVRYDPARADRAALVAAVEGAGYGVAEVSGTGAGKPEVGRRLALAIALGAPLLALSMLPPLQFEGWEWLALALATPVVLWSGSGLHLAATRNLRHGAATMDTLVSLGTLAAYGWSVAALFRADAEIYFETAAAITA